MKTRLVYIFVVVGATLLALFTPPPSPPWEGR
jgi:hypothetical protein